MGEPNGNAKGKKIGFIGLGSIGLRHLNSLISLGVNEFFHLRTGKGSKIIPDDLSKFIKTIENVEEFQNVDGIVISNPTSLHGEALKKILYLGKPLFIEKPLSDSFEETRELIKLLENYSARVQIGFTLRYNPIIKKVKQIIDSGLLGEIYFSRLGVGQYLPFWHPYTDYRQEYFSRRSLGGGAVRTLSHEIDLAIYFFGNPVLIDGFIGKVSPLEIDVDDFADINFGYEKKKLKLSIDFLSREPYRTGVIMGREGDLHYDIFKHQLYWINNKAEKLIIEFEEKDMYIEQMRGFLEDMDNSFSNLNDSNTIIHIINQLEKQNKN